MSDIDIRPERLEVVMTGRPTLWWARAVFSDTYNRDRAYSAMIRSFRDSPAGSVAFREGVIAAFKAATRTPSDHNYIEITGSMVRSFRNVSERHGIPITTLEARPAQALS